MGRRHHHQPQHKSRVKVVHNVAKGPSVNVSVDGKTVLSNVTYKTQSDYLELPSGSHNLGISVNGDELTSKQVVLKPNTDYTVIAHGDINDLGSIDLLVLQDDNSCPASGKAHVRFIHAAAGAPAVDVWAGTTDKIFTNVSYGETGKPVYLPVNAGSVDVSVTGFGSVERVVGPVSLNLENRKVYSIIATGIIGDGEAPLGALVKADQKCTVHTHSQLRNKPHSMNRNNSIMMDMWAFM